MSGPDAMHGEMPGFFPGRPGGERDEPLLDMIFDRRPIPPGAPPEMHDLARMLAAAAGPAEPGELAGEATALAAFARLASPASISPAARRPARRRLSRRPARARLPLAAALVTAAAGLGSITAAYVGVLPSPIQHFAHVTVGAPPPTHSTSRRPPAVTNAQPSVTHDPGTSAPRSSRSAALTQVPGASNRPRPRHERPGRGPVPVTCHLHPWGWPHSHAGQAEPDPEPGQAEPDPERGQAEPDPEPSEPGAPGSTLQVPPSAGCLDIATPNGVPPPSW